MRAFKSKAQLKEYLKDSEKIELQKGTSPKKKTETKKTTKSTKTGGKK